MLGKQVHDIPHQMVLTPFGLTNRCAFFAGTVI